jgi:hypothetical protein
MSNSEQVAMTVSQLIEWLQTQPQHADVLIHDTDTGWYIPVKGGVYENDILYPQPENSVCLHGRYNERIGDE